MLGHRAHELRLHSPFDRSGPARVRRRVVRELAPAQEEVRSDVGDERALEPEARVVPAERVARRMLAAVEPLSFEGGQVDAADERDVVVDDDELLVVAVHRPLVRVERHRDARAADELVAHPPHLAAVRVEERQRRTGPGEHAHVDALGRSRKQLT